jgi:endonuclease YncB( thermonuclease family)
MSTPTGTAKRPARARVGSSPRHGISRRRSDLAKLVAACVSIAGFAAFVIPQPERESMPRAHHAVVVRVVDGDTIVLADVGKARLIGLDTPEVFGPDAPQCFGAAASTYAKRVLTGVTVRWAWGLEKRDRFQRALVYVWLPSGRFLNEDLLALGMARVLTIAPNDRYETRFQAAQRAARKRHSGLWRACPTRAFGL